MRLRGFRVVFDDPSLEVWEVADVDLSAMEVLEKQYVSTEPFAPSKRGPGVPLHARVGTFRFRVTRNDVREIRGVIVVKRVAAGAHELLSRLEPTGDTWIDRALRQAASTRSRRRAFADRIETAAEEARGPSPAEAVAGPVIFDSLADLGAERIDAPEEPYVVCKADRAAIGVEEVIEVCGVAVPRRRWLLSSSDLDESAIFWDGRRISVTRAPLDDVPMTFFASVDVGGFATDEIAPLAIGAPELCPRFLLVPPSPESVLSAADMDASDQVLREACFVLDSRESVALDPSSQLRVIRDPAIIRHILLRTVRGRLYVPGATELRSLTAADVPRAMVGALPEPPV